MARVYENVYVAVPRCHTIRDLLLRPIVYRILLKPSSTKSPEQDSCPSSLLPQIDKATNSRAHKKARPKTRTHHSQNLYETMFGRKSNPSKNGLPVMGKETIMVRRCITECEQETRTS